MYEKLNVDGEDLKKIKERLKPDVKGFDLTKKEKYMDK